MVLETTFMPERHYSDLDGVSHFVVSSNIDCDNKVAFCQDSEKPGMSGQVG